MHKAIDLALVNIRGLEHKSPMGGDGLLHTCSAGNDGFAPVGGPGANAPKH